MESERQWYRRKSDGQRGYLHAPGVVRLDRPSQVLLEPIGHSWTPEINQKPLTKFQAAQVCFSADVQLCRALGVPLKTKEWMSLTDEQRIDFADKGPDEPAIRAVVYERVKSALTDFTQS